jgi:hypothetical protein
MLGRAMSGPVTTGMLCFVVASQSGQCAVRLGREWLDVVGLVVFRQSRLGSARFGTARHRIVGWGSLGGLRWCSEMVVSVTVGYGMVRLSLAVVDRCCSVWHGAAQSGRSRQSRSGVARIGYARRRTASIGGAVKVVFGGACCRRVRFGLAVSVGFGGARTGMARCGKAPMVRLGSLGIGSVWHGAVQSGRVVAVEVWLVAARYCRVGRGSLGIAGRGQVLLDLAVGVSHGTAG